MSSLDRHRQILDAAERLFRHYGPAKTTIGDIAREAGIGVGSVYLEFSSKEAIVAELAGARRQRIATAMRAAARRGDHGSRVAAALEARIRALFQLAADGAHGCDLVTCASAARSTAGAPHGSPGRFGDEERELLSSLLAAGMAAGEFAEADPAHTARVIEHAYAALSPPWVFSRPAEEALALARELNRLIVEGLKRREERGRQQG
jgi:AcrR family transcriptional regulator